MARALYPELRRIAASLGRQFGNPETLRRTALVSEAFLKLRRSGGFVDEAHFLRTAARAMRQVLVNHARARSTLKRGSGNATVELTDDLPVFWTSDEAVVDLDDALEALGQVDARLVSVVECRFFGGFDEAETASILGVSDRTVRRDWVKARAILQGLMDANASRQDQ
jgi:RNA polymerase sigma factor (TIGR02999 family)